jgi:isopenicillin-N epimerase
MLPEGWRGGDDRRLKGAIDDARAHQQPVGRVEHGRVALPGRSPRIAGATRGLVGLLRAEPRGLWSARLLSVSALLDRLSFDHRVPPASLATEWTTCWPLDPRYTFLNHGSFGSVPIPVAQAQEQHRELIEARPIEVLGRRCRELLAPVRERIGRFVRADAAGVGLLTNATEGVNSVLRSIDFRPGDVLITTDHVYRAVLQAMRYVARRAGAEIRVVPIPLPTSGDDEIVQRISDAIDPRTRLVLVDHVTSPTAVVFPVERIAGVCRERGIECLIDGAHAPGMLDLHIGALGATYYTGNFHKWVCAPKGSAFLWVDESRRRCVHPSIISHFLDEGFDTEFDWQGTRDISAWLTINDALAFFEPLGWQRLRDHNRQLATWAREVVRGELGTESLVPLPSPTGGPFAQSMLASIATVELPAAIRTRWAGPEALQADLYERARIEVPIIDWGGRWHVRLSAQAYNRPEQYQTLAKALCDRVFG